MAACKFTVAFTTEDQSPLHKKVKHRQFLRCKSGCGRMSVPETGAIVSSTGASIPEAQAHECPIGKKVAAAAAAVSLQQQNEAAKEKIKLKADHEKAAKKRPRAGDPPADGEGARDPQADDAEEDDESTAIVWTEKNTGLSADMLKFFCLKWSDAVAMKRWESVLQSIAGRSSEDIKLDAIDKRIDAIKSKSPDPKSEEAMSRAHVRALVYAAAPVNASDLRILAGLLAVVDVLQTTKPVVAIKKARVMRKADGDLSARSVVMESVSAIFELAGRIWLRNLFLTLIAEAKGDPCPFIIKDGSKRIAVLAPERFATILFRSHIEYTSRLPPHSTMPPMNVTLTTKWSVPCWDRPQPWDGLPMFIMAGILCKAAEANPEDLPSLHRRTAFELFIRFSVTKWATQWCHSAANLSEVKKYNASATGTEPKNDAVDKNPPKADPPTTRHTGGGRGGGGRGGGGGGAASAPSAQEHARIKAENQQLRQQVKQQADLPPPPAPFHTPNRSALTLPPPPLTPLPAAPSPATGGRVYTRCEWAGCTRSPPSGSSPNPYCGIHSGNRDNKFSHGGRGGGSAGGGFSATR